jgi:RNA polymerase sigma-70 factor (ECF subfamily)
MWSNPPHPWPHEQLMRGEERRLIFDTIDSLSPSQRAVITMRDVEGFDAEDVCNVLGITDTNQRVLLHRARSHVRHALEEYFDEDASS